MKTRKAWRCLCSASLMALLAMTTNTTMGQASDGLVPLNYRGKVIRVPSYIIDRYLRAGATRIGGGGTATIGTQGGTVTLPGVGTATFPVGALPVAMSVEVSATNSPQTDQTFRESRVLFGNGQRLSYEVRIRVDGGAPALDVPVAITLPADFVASVPATAEIRIFALNRWRGDNAEALDTFELMTPRFLRSDATATVTVPKYFFNPIPGGTSFEVTLIVATTETAQMTAPFVAAPASRTANQPAESPGWNAPDGTVYLQKDRMALMESLVAAAVGATCDGSTLRPPLAGTLTVTSPYGPRNLNIGSGDFHYGVDFAASVGTPVLAMQDGRIEYVRVEQDSAGNPKGWGQYIVVQGPAGRTLYAHLTLGSATRAIGANVSAGDVIGLSGNSGLGTGPHLHVEYAPNGSIFARDEKVNPQPCIESNVIGSVTVRDNGALADDSFRLLINDQAVGETQIGAANTFALGNLRPGTAMLTLRCLIAPDNVGTYEISLAQGLTFSSGGVLRSGTLTQGGSISFQITIPN